MLVAAAVCPHPPLLVPEAAGGPQPGDAMDSVRAACDAAVACLLAAEPGLLVVVGGADRSALYDGSATGSLREFGVSFVTGTGEPVLPLSLTVGAWLLGHAGGQGPGARPAEPAIQFRAVARHIPAAECLRLGAEIARQAARVAVLAMGDGSGRMAAGIPGAPDPGAECYDAEVAGALAAADAGRLARLSPALDDELMVAGRPAWQVLAGAARGCRYQGRLHCAARPHAVSYLVASWDACS